MISKLTRVRLLAVLCGPLLGAFIAFAGSLSMKLALRLLPNTDASIWEPVSYVMAWIPVTIFVAVLAAIYGAYDLLVIVTCAIPALLFFGCSYTAAISIFLPDNGHTLYDVFGLYPPLDYADQLGFLFRLLLGAIVIAASGIALERWLLRRHEMAGQLLLRGSEDRRVWRCLAFDVGFLFLVMCIVLAVDLRQRLRLGTPDVITADVTRVLDSPTSTVADREEALARLKEFSNKFCGDDVQTAVTMLQRELPSQPEPVNLDIAQALILFHDNTGAPALEAALARSSEPTAIAPPGGWAGVVSSLAMTHAPIRPSAILPLMASPDASLRQEAARALRETMSLRQKRGGRFVPDWDADIDVAAITTAMVAALDDSDQMVRYFAVCTLMEINDNPHYPATFLFEENEAAYVNGWKEWARQQKPASPR